MDFKAVWESMEECQRLGLTKSIGVCNFSCKKLENLLACATIPPSVNQVSVKNESSLHPIYICVCVYLYVVYWLSMVCVVNNLNFEHSTITLMVMIKRLISNVNRWRWAQCGNRRSLERYVLPMVSLWRLTPLWERKELDGEPIKSWTVKSSRRLQRREERPLLRFFYVHFFIFMFLSHVGTFLCVYVLKHERIK